MKWRGFESELSSGLYCTNWYGSPDHSVYRFSNRQCIGSTTNTISNLSQRVRVSSNGSVSL